MYFLQLEAKELVRTYNQDSTQLDVRQDGTEDPEGKVQGCDGKLALSGYCSSYYWCYASATFHNNSEHSLEEDAVSFATDSITTVKPLPGIVGNDLGGMKLADSASDMFCIQNGFRRSNGNWKLRGLGFDKEKKVEIEHKDTIETADGRVVLLLERKRPQRLKSAILRGRLCDIGKFQTFKREIDLNADTKRYWPGRITSIHSDLCVGSASLDINLDGRLYAKESSLVFYAEQADYNPYDNEG